jgi:Ribonuclease G/E
MNAAFVDIGLDQDAFLHFSDAGDLDTDDDGDSDADDDEDSDEDENLFVPDMIAEHLLPGQVAVFEHVGHEKLRYLSGWAIAVFDDGRQIRVSLGDIYAMAASEFGVDRNSITAAAY